MEFIKKHSKTLILLTLWCALAFLVFWVNDVLMPFALALLLAYVLDPVVSKISQLKIKNRQIPRFTAVLILYLCLFAGIYLFSTLFLPQLYNEFKKLGSTTLEWLAKLKETNLHEFSIQIERSLETYGLPVEDLNIAQLLETNLQKFFDFVKTKSTSFVGGFQSFATGLFGFIFNFVLVLMITAFVLVDTQRIKNFVYSLVTKKGHLALDSTIEKIDQGLSGVVRGQLMICLINAVLTLVGLILLKIKFALVLATVAGIFSLIPIFGSIISTVPIALVALMTSSWTAALAILWIAFIHALESNFLNPKIMGRSANIHPALVILALIAGEHFYGIFGALLAVPIASILVTLFQSVLAKAQSYDG